MGGHAAQNGGFSGSELGVRLRAGTMRRFWGRVRRQGECWRWQGPLTAAGYPVAKISGVQGGHRIAWVWKHGKVPKGCLRNKCGDLACVNPAHWKEDAPKALSRPVQRRLEIERLFREGVGIGEIADRVGCSRVTVWRRTHANTGSEPGRAGAAEGSRDE